MLRPNFSFRGWLYNYVWTGDKILSTLYHINCDYRFEVATPKERLKMRDIFITYIKKNSNFSYWELVWENCIELWGWILWDLRRKQEDFHDSWVYYSGTTLETKIWDEIVTNIYFFAVSCTIPFNISQYRYYKSIYKYWRSYNLKVTSFYYWKNYKNSFKKKFQPQDVLVGLLKTLFFFNDPEISKLTFKIILEVIYNFFKTIFIALLISLIFFIFFINFFYLTILRQLGIWVIFGALGFWLFSGFNFFIKRYRSSKFTSALNRFWKRSNIYFWLVEGCLFALFFYYYLNSSQEPIYMYDFAALTQTHLPNLYTLYLNSWVLLLCLAYFYYWMLNLAGYNTQQNIFHIFIIILFFLYLYLNETYQFYYLLTYLTEFTWLYNMESNLWVLETDTPRTRVKYQYLIFLLTAKYWHFVFIFLSLLFWALKTFEQDRAYYTLSGYNLQNFILLFWLNLIFAGQWLKWISRRFLDSVYFWFFSDSNFQFARFFAIECGNYLSVPVLHRRTKKPTAEWYPHCSTHQPKETYSHNSL